MLKEKARKARKGLKLLTQDSMEFLNKVTSADGWQNAVTGMGITGRDKGASIEYSSEGRLDRARLDEMGRSDGLARNIVEIIVDDAMRSGWVVSFKSDDENEVTPEQAIEFNEQVKKWEKDTRFKSRVSQHLKQSRLQGGSLLTLGAIDGQKPDQPLDPSKVTSFRWFRAHDRHQVSISSAIDDDPKSIGFGFPESYRLHSVHAQGVGSNRDEMMIDTEVHNSRVWRTDGTILSDRVRIQNGGWGDSVLEVCNEPLGNHGGAMKATRTIVQEWVQGVYKIKDLPGQILANGGETIRQRFHVMDHMRSLWQAIMIDADFEDYERKVVTAAGLPETLDRFMVHLSAVARMPMTLLFGVSPGGFGTGEAEGDNWDDKVKAYQTDVIEPLLDYVYGVLFQTPEFEGFPQNWSIKFNSLQLTDPVEDAEIRLKTAQTDALYIQMGSLDPDEVAISRFAGATYSTETQLDEEGRKMDAALEAEGLGDTAAEALNGIQITSLLDILERVKTGVLPKESAKVAIQVSLPQVTPEAINGMVDPIEVTGPIDPDAPPAPFIPPTSTPPSPPADASGAESTEPDADEEPS